ncbi:serine hydrolase [Acidaminococcus massiliensis]|uniref:serine hydrolase n=1 Tax=Acidaminococcus massiliensis TaxID=1852375 RepID=UPI00266BF849|nr:serine hydrolase [Acidaminococcus massiliensis]
MKSLNKGIGLLLTGLLLLSGVGVPRTTQASAPAAASARAALSPRLQKIGRIIREAGPAQVYFTNLATNQSIYLGSETMPSASMIKVFILAKAYEDIQDGRLSRKETFTLTSDNVVGGAGVLQGRGYGSKVPLQEALELMITESDNTAANLLIDRLGMDRINAYMQSHGYTHSVLRRKMMDTEAMEAGRENLTSTRDIALLFKRLYQGKCVGPAQDREMLAIYKRQTDNDSIPGDLPQGTVVAHKTGEVNDFRHDGGIIYTPKGDYVLVIFTRNYTPYGTMAELSEKIYQAFVE